jgi:hypothetical protein
MLRGIGFSLIVAGALGVLAPLGAIFRDLLGYGWIYGLDLTSYLFSPAFAACGLAAGVILVRRKLLKRGAAFWVAALGASVCAPLAAIHIVLLLWGLFSGQEFWSIETIIMFPVSWDGWWPPREFLFCDTLMFASPFRETLFWYGAPLHEPLQFVCSPQRSLVFWTYLPLAICLQAICGRPGKWADRFFGLLAVLLAVLLLISVTEIAWAHYQQATYKPAPGDVVDYMYQPELRWYAYFAIVVFWLLAIAVLLVQRKPEAGIGSSP